MPWIFYPRLAGRVILVAGAAKGIGRAICRRLAAEGARIACADLDATGAAKPPEMPVRRRSTSPAMLPMQDRRGTLSSTHSGCFGAVHGLINNAATLSVSGTVVDLAENDWDREIAVSLTGAFLMSKFAVPAIAAARGGRSTPLRNYGRVAVAGSAANCAAKAALVNFAKVMALDHTAETIRVNALSPGTVATHRLRASHGTRSDRLDQSPDRPHRPARRNRLGRRFFDERGTQFYNGIGSPGGRRVYRMVIKKRWRAFATVGRHRVAPIVISIGCHKGVDKRQKMREGWRPSGWILGKIVDTAQVNGCLKMRITLKL
jgi:NAD(P)-dependent dehydrogenase (short-subunit alcohol dehydrogenase family)